MKMLKKILIAVVACVTLNFYTANVSAEVKTFHEENEYIMEKSEPIKKAQDKAFQKTVRQISESVGYYLESDSSLKNAKLTEDRMELFTAAILKIKSKIFNKEILSDGNLKIIASVDAEVDTDNVKEILNELAEAKNSEKDYERILTEYTEKQEQYDTVYGEYINSYQKRLNEKIRKGCKLQNDNKLEKALNTYNEVIADTISNGSELSKVYIKRGHLYNMQKKNKLATADFEKAISLNNDSVGVHYAKAFLLEQKGKKNEAFDEYKIFLKDADILYYDSEITDAVNKLTE